MKKKPTVYRSVMLPEGIHKKLKMLAAKDRKTIIQVIVESLELYKKADFPVRNLK